MTYSNLVLIILIVFFGAMAVGAFGLACWRLGEEFIDWRRGRKRP